MKASPLAGAILAAVALPSGIAASETVQPQATSCTSIKNVRQLQAIRKNLAGSYCLANDIDAGPVENFVPIGDTSKPFTGRFIGNGWVIRNLKINSDAPHVGLFGTMHNALIQDVGLVNVDITGTADAANVGGIVGRALSPGSIPAMEIRRVHVTGRISGTGSLSRVGGLGGFLSSLKLTDSWTASEVSGTGFVGGLAGYAGFGTFGRVYATGPVTCGETCFAGGLVGRGQAMTITHSYASGPVDGGDSSTIGGLAGYTSTIEIYWSHALGRVTTGTGAATAGGLVGHLAQNDDLREVYSAGRVTGGVGAVLGGLVGVKAMMSDAEHAYWDIGTSGQTASATGIGYATSQLRAALPPGLGNAWAITGKRSYPFLNENDIEFAAPLATLVVRKRLFTFLPISQQAREHYANSPAAADGASLAAVYTMIARAIGITRNVAALKGLKIDKYFWNDVTRTATWRGPVTTRATLGTFAAIPAGVTLNDTDVISEMNSARLVMLRGRYTTAGGASARHWLLGTLHTKRGKKVSAIVANDPWTGKQVTIDPATKRVVSPENFPLNNFTVDGYQPVTLN